jgi:hypothetical protein
MNEKGMAFLATQNPSKGLTGPQLSWLTGQLARLTGYQLVVLALTISAKRQCV